MIDSEYRRAKKAVKLIGILVERKYEKKDRKKQRKNETYGVENQDKIKWSCTVL